MVLIMVAYNKNQETSYNSASYGKSRRIFVVVVYLHLEIQSSTLADFIH
jgi:hypothetical protein